MNTPWMVDWLVLWKWFYYPFFFWTYVLGGVLLKAFVTPWLGLPSPWKAWAISSTASVPFVLCVPVAALPVFMLASLPSRRFEQYSILLAVPIAMSVGIVATLMDRVLFRLALRERMKRKEFLLLYATNAGNMLLATGVILGWEFTHPTQVIA